MPPVFDHRRPVSPVSSNLRKQAVDSFRFTRVLDQRVVDSLRLDLHRQIFTGDQILKTLLLAEAQVLPLAEIIQRQRHRIVSYVVLYGIYPIFFLISNSPVVLPDSSVTVA